MLPAHGKEGRHTLSGKVPAPGTGGMQMRGQGASPGRRREFPEASGWQLGGKGPHHKGYGDRGRSSPTISSLALEQVEGRRQQAEGESLCRELPPGGNGAIKECSLPCAPLFDGHG